MPSGQKLARKVKIVVKLCSFVITVAKSATFAMDGDFAVGAFPFTKVENCRNRSLRWK